MRGRDLALVFVAGLGAAGIVSKRHGSRVFTQQDMVYADLPSLLYRVTDPKKPWVGEGSFWSPTAAGARAFSDRTRSQIVTTEPRGTALRFSDDEALSAYLDEIGIQDASDRVLDADWVKPDVFLRLRQMEIAWIVRPIDLSVSTAEEWIFTGYVEAHAIPTMGNFFLPNTWTMTLLSGVGNQEWVQVKVGPKDGSRGRITLQRVSDRKSLCKGLLRLFKKYPKDSVWRVAEVQAGTWQGEGHGYRLYLAAAQAAVQVTGGPVILTRDECIAGGETSIAARRVWLNLYTRDDFVADGNEEAIRVTPELLQLYEPEEAG